MSLNSPFRIPFVCPPGILAPDKGQLLRQALHIGVFDAEHHPVRNKSINQLNNLEAVHLLVDICVRLPSVNCDMTYFCCVSPARMRILWTSMLAPSESPDHQEDTIFSMLDVDQPLVSSHLNFNIRRSPMSFSATSRNECVLLLAIFSFLPDDTTRR